MYIYGHRRCMLLEEDDVFVFFLTHGKYLRPLQGPVSKEVLLIISSLYFLSLIYLPLAGYI